MMKEGILKVKEIENLIDDFWKQQNIYWIGGSSCSGKSTIAEIIAKKHDLTYFKCDDFMYKHIEKSDKDKHPIMNKHRKMSWNEIWMRPVDVQVIEEFDFFREESEMLLNEISLSIKNRPAIVEGAALLPELINNLRINKDRVLYIVSTKDFQVSHYLKRQFADDILCKCESPKIAFDNWMQRDVQFANIIFDDANKLENKKKLLPR